MCKETTDTRSKIRGKWLKHLIGSKQNSTQATKVIPTNISALSAETYSLSIINWTLAEIKKDEY